MIFAALCGSQLILGVLMFSFGIADRTTVRLLLSYLMLPIWVGILVGLAGVCGIVIGYHNKRQGFPNVNMVSAIRAINIMCVGLSIVLLYMYGSTLATISYYDDNDSAYSLTRYTADKDTAQAILSLVVILSFAEMFVGCWLAMFDKDQMMIGFRPQQDTRGLIRNQTQNPYYAHPAHTAAHPQVPSQQVI